MCGCCRLHLQLHCLQRLQHPDEHPSLRLGRMHGHGRSSRDPGVLSGPREGLGSGGVGECEGCSVPVSWPSHPTLGLQTPSELFGIGFQGFRIQKVIGGLGPCNITLRAFSVLSFTLKSPFIFCASFCVAGWMFVLASFLTFSVLRSVHFTIYMLFMKPFRQTSGGFL